MPWHRAPRPSRRPCQRFGLPLPSNRFYPSGMATQPFFPTGGNRFYNMRTREILPWPPSTAPPSCPHFHELVLLPSPPPPPPTALHGGCTARYPTSLYATPPPRVCDIPSGCSFFMGPWSVTRSSRAASGPCVLSTAAACDPAGVVFALAEPSSWRTGGCAGCCEGRFTVFAAHSPPRPGRPPHASPCFRVREAQLLPPSTCCPGRPPPASPPPGHNKPQSPQDAPV